MEERDKLLEITHKNNIETRPVWTPMHKLKINNKYEASAVLENTDWLFERIVCMPSSYSENLDL